MTVEKQQSEGAASCPYVDNGVVYDVCVAPGGRVWVGEFVSMAVSRPFWTLAPLWRGTQPADTDATVDINPDYIIYVSTHDEAL